MLATATNLLGAGTLISKQAAKRLRRIGPEGAPSVAITDPHAKRRTRIATRREWPDSPTSDVPDRYQLCVILKAHDLVAWPELGVAVDTDDRVAAYLHSERRWTTVDSVTTGALVVETTHGGAHVLRAFVRKVRRCDARFNGAQAFIEAVACMRLEIERLNDAIGHQRERF